MKCCGKGRSSRFCPDCGVDLFTVEGLINTLRGWQKEAELKVEEHKREMNRWANDLPGEYNKQAARNVHKWEMEVTKFKAWADVVDALADKKRGGEA